MATVNRFEDLRAWQQARELSKQIAPIVMRNKNSGSRKFFDQLAGSSGSVMDNIAEGFGRSSRKEFIQFLFIANGSLMETRSQLYRAVDYNYIVEDELKKLLKLSEEISAMIFCLSKYLQKSTISGQKHT